MHDQHVWRRYHQRDRRQILDGIVAHRMQERRQPRRTAIEQQRMAIGRCFGDDFRRNAAAVFHHHRLSETAGEFLRDQPCDPVVVAADFSGDDAHCLDGIVILAERRARRGDEHADRQDSSGVTQYQKLPPR